MIVALKWQGLSFTDIATAIGKHRSTIYREVQRKTCWHKDDSYRPIRAQQRTRARRRRSRRNQHFTEKDYMIIRQLLHKQWSPEKITGYLKWIGVRCFSHETIYRYIWRDKRNAACYGSTCVVLKSEDVNATRLMIVEAGLPISAI
ncbi:MAG: helix-turn-helix domain-containing protein [Candidatus Endonucleobacter sp. (ex Gigantidas childressi)]|nr:helix-turn-helix domain-containing protein [Candidatus Endonucleobacter sp. (ex Gigantidas childressi)]